MICDLLLAAMPVHDIIRQQDEAKSHRIEFVLWPQMWKEYSKAVKRAFQWKIVPFHASQISKVPNRKGVYTFLIQPGIASHAACSYLLYVGKAEKQTFRERFKQYLYEVSDPKGRPKIVRLAKHQGYTFFCCAEIVPESLIDRMEKRLINAYLPPYNDTFPAKVRRIIGGLR